MIEVILKCINANLRDLGYNKRVILDENPCNQDGVPIRLTFINEPNNLELLEIKPLLQEFDDMGVDVLSILTASNLIKTRTPNLVHIDITVTKPSERMQNLLETVEAMPNISDTTEFVYAALQKRLPGLPKYTELSPSQLSVVGHQLQCLIDLIQEV